MRRNKPFPICNDLCAFLKNAWELGWLDEYSDEHYLIKAIENRLNDFVGKEQLINNDCNFEGIINSNGSINTTAFNMNFCINFSIHMNYLSNTFGPKQIEKFITDQMSAGKENYKENAFFEALSEVSILCFYSSRNNWEKVIYEPPLCKGINLKNPEARFIGKILCKTCEKEKIEVEREITV